MPVRAASWLSMLLLVLLQLHGSTCVADEAQLAGSGIGLSRLGRSPSTCRSSFGKLPEGWCAPELTPPNASGTSAKRRSTPSRWQPGSSSRPHWRKNLFKRVLTDQAYLFTTWWPEEVRRPEFSAPLLAAIITARDSAADGGGIDLASQTSFESWSSGTGRQLAQGFSRLGDGQTALILVGGTYLIARWTRHERMARTASLSAEALLNTAIYSTVLKRVTRRTRPSGGGTGEFFVDRPAAGQSPSSFPSGHAMGAFSVAAILAAEFREKRWVVWVAYGTASLVALSRVALGRHFPTDVLAGAILGRSLGRMVARRERESLEGRPASRFEPFIDPQNGGVGLAYRISW